MVRLEQTREGQYFLDLHPVVKFIVAELSTNVCLSERLFAPHAVDVFRRDSITETGHDVISRAPLTLIPMTMVG